MKDYNGVSCNDNSSPNPKRKRHKRELNKFYNDYRKKGIAGPT